MRFTDAEWTVMNVLWRRHPASARDVLEQVQQQTGWAYTTVKTVLARLVEKQALTMRKRANTCLYEPLVTRTNARMEAIRLLVEKAFDGTFGSLFHHLIAEEKLSKKDRQKLQQMLEELPREGDARKS